MTRRGSQVQVLYGPPQKPQVSGRSLAAGAGVSSRRGALMRKRTAGDPGAGAEERWSGRAGGTLTAARADDVRSVVRRVAVPRQPDRAAARVSAAGGASGRRVVAVHFAVAVLRVVGVVRWEVDALRPGALGEGAAVGGGGGVDAGEDVAVEGPALLVDQV